MVKKLRAKFVLITMTLMVTVFSILYIVNLFYTSYWNNLDILQTLDLLADCRGFEDSWIIENVSETWKDYSICYVKIADDGKIITQMDTNGRAKIDIPSGLIEEVRGGGEYNWKWKNYIYTSRTYENGDIGIYYINKLEFSEKLSRIFIRISIMLIGFAMLFLVSNYLSRYVVKPAENALEREKQFIADASHELKTPITAISINAEVLKEMYGGNQHLEYIISEAKRMERLVRKLLSLSFIESRGKEFEKTRFSLSECCEKIVLTMESVAFEKEVEYYYNIEQDIFYIGNMDEIEQVIIILIDNAIKHARSHGEVTISLKMEKNHPTLRVVNTGEQISDEDLVHIFERFYSHDRESDRENESFGLGLAIAKSIVESHNGTIVAKNENEMKVCFCVMF